MVSGLSEQTEETQTSFVKIEFETLVWTGDIVKQDEKGFFTLWTALRTRSSTRVIVFPASEIEAVLQEHPAVIESCVVDYPILKWAAHQGIRGPQERCERESPAMK